MPPSFALVGKTLAQADSIARTLDPELDPIALLEDEARGLTRAEAERNLHPDALLSMLFTQLGPLSRLPRRVGQIADRLETRGLVRRQSAEGDRRVKALTITPKGVKLREQVVELMTQPPAAIAALDEEDQLALRDILARAVENLHRGL